MESVIRGVKCALDSAENMLTAFSIGTTSEYSALAYGVPILVPCGVVDFVDVQGSNSSVGCQGGSSRRRGSPKGNRL